MQDFCLGGGGGGHVNVIQEGCPAVWVKSATAPRVVRGPLYICNLEASEADGAEVGSRAL